MPPAREHSAPTPAPASAPAGFAIPNPAKSGPGRIWKKIKSGATLLIFDIPALWRSVLSARAPECQK